MSAEPPSKVLKMADVEKQIVESETAAPVKKTVTDTLDYQYNDISDGSKLLFKKLSKNATTPLRGSKNAAGFDLFSAEEKIIPGRKHDMIKTDIAVALPKGSYGRVAPRSGLAKKNGIDVGAGVVDVDYRGNLGVILFNHLDTDFHVKVGDRIAQFIVEQIFMPKLVEVEELDETDRGAGGFGSTGR